MTSGKNERTWKMNGESEGGRNGEEGSRSSCMKFGEGTMSPARNDSHQYMGPKPPLADRLVVAEKLLRMAVDARQVF